MEMENRCRTMIIRYFFIAVSTNLLGRLYALGGGGTAQIAE